MSTNPAFVMLREILVSWLYNTTKFFLGTELPHIYLATCALICSSLSYLLHRFRASIYFQGDSFIWTLIVVFCVGWSRAGKSSTLTLPQYRISKWPAKQIKLTEQCVVSVEGFAVIVHRAASKPLNDTSSINFLNKHWTLGRKLFCNCRLGNFWHGIILLAPHGTEN